VTPKKQLIILKGEDKTDSIRSWERNGDKIDITFLNNKTIYHYNADDVKFVDSTLANPTADKCFKYLYEVAQTVGIIVNGKNILVNHYEKIDFFGEDSMLSSFLLGQLNLTENSRNTEALYPFGFNISQKQAVENALSSPLSIIEGPPGTGKTQTILNIIANAVMQGKSVAIVSNNNSATMNVLDKLKKYDVDFIAAYLGNNNNKREFIESQKPLPDFSTWKLSEKHCTTLQQSLRRRSATLSDMLAKKNKLAALNSELSEVEMEQTYFKEYCERIITLAEPTAIHNVETAQNALEMWLLCEGYERLRGKGIIAFIKSILETFGSIGKRKREIRELLKNYRHDYLIAVFQWQFYEFKISELKRQISTLLSDIETFDFDAKMREYSDISAELFRNYLADKYAERKRTRFELNDLWKKSKEFITDYPVILSTTYSLRSSLSSKVMYDYVIIDESSQVDLATGVLALSCARKVVVVGDLKQLSNVVTCDKEKETDKLFKKYYLPKAYRYKNHSLLLAVTELFANAPRVLLREHYRCHPKIIEFCNQKFYNGELIILTEPKSIRQPLVAYQTAEGNHARGHTNQRQIDVIKKDVISEQKLDIECDSIGIVTPYCDQVNEFHSEFAGTGVKADTVDKFQGRENDIIILSTVDNKVNNFSDNANRLNVAVSRAVEQLIVVVSAADTKRDTNLGDLVRYIRYNNFEVIQSEIYSVFDYLYKSYAKKRTVLLPISAYKSENIIFALIQKTLKKEQFAKYDVTPHVQLRTILRDQSKLNDEEIRYAMNILTHVDFLIFNKLSKMPLLVVEVDGVSYHKDGTRQAERDKLKNAILKKYGLAYIRFKTNGSEEDKRLISALEEAIEIERRRA